MPREDSRKKRRGLSRTGLAPFSHTLRDFRAFLNSGVTPANQTKERAKTKVHEFRPFL